MYESFDVLINDSRIIEGTGKPAFKGSIRIIDEKIVAVGNVVGDAAREIDGSGPVACPGFIDPHSHADLPLLQYPLAENLVMQGITTFLGGNSGLSMAPLKSLFPSRFANTEEWWHEVEPDTPGPPQFLSLDRYGEISKEKLGFAIDRRNFGEFLSKVENTGISVNYAPLVGHNPYLFYVPGSWKVAELSNVAQPYETNPTLLHTNDPPLARPYEIGLNTLRGRFIASPPLVSAGIFMRSDVSTQTNLKITHRAQKVQAEA